MPATVTTFQKPAAEEFMTDFAAEADWATSATGPGLSRSVPKAGSGGRFRIADLVLSRNGNPGGNTPFCASRRIMPGSLPTEEPARHPSLSTPRVPRYENVKALWEERFERRYGFWKGFYDTAVERYLDGGLVRLVSPASADTACPNEFLVASSCKGRALCPSFGAKRAAIFP